MRLTELEPRWVGECGAPDDAKQGVSFWCPHCPAEKSTRMAVFFDAPICGRAAVDIKAFHENRLGDDAAADHLNDHHVGKILWHREGETFDNLTLTPSIDASHFGHWHGFITNGEVK